MAEAASLSSLEKQRLIALAQEHESQVDSLEELGAPAAAVYEKRSGGVMELLEDLKEKATTELSELRKAEAAAQHEFDLLRQSLKSEANADAKELAEEKKIKAGASEEKATSTGELEELLKELPKDERNLEDVLDNCERKDADHEATVKSREEELKAVDEATRIVKEATGGAAKQTYSLLQVTSRSNTDAQLRTRADLVHLEALALVKRLARAHNSPVLAQLAVQMSSIMRTAGAVGADPFAKIKGLIKDLISKLEAEAASESTEKAYCDDEMGKTKEKKDDLSADLDKVTSKLEKATNTVSKLKEDVAELQSQLAKLASSQAEMDKIRKEGHEDYTEAKADLEKGLTGVRRALAVLRDYYSQDKAAAAMVQASDSSEALEADPRPKQHNQA
jgi:chromosome segregation ATPase